MRNGSLFLVAVFLGLGGFRESHAAVPDAAPAARPLDVEALNGLVQKTPSAMLAYVRDEIRNEIYSGALRGPIGTLWSGAGNSVDKSLLLCELLRRAGLPCRYARARISPEQGTEIIERSLAGLHEDPSFRQTPESEQAGGTYRPTDDPRLMEAVTDHWWVQFWDGNGWIDLDPTGAESKVGSSIAESPATYASIPSEIRYRIRVAVWATLGKAPQVQETCVARLTAFSDEVAGKAVTLKHEIRRTEDGQKLTSVRPCLVHGNEVVVGRDLCGLMAEDDQVVDSKQLPLQRMDLQCLCPGGKLLSFSNSPARDFSGIHEVAVLFCPGRVPCEAAEAASELGFETDAPRRLEQSAQSEALALAWASISDEVTDKIARQSGVLAYPTYPAAMLVEAAPQFRAVRLQSCWTERSVVGPEGTDPRAFASCQAYSTLGRTLGAKRLLEGLTKQPVTDPLLLLSQALRSGAKLEALSGEEGRHRLKELPVSAPTRQCMERALNEGSVLVLPTIPPGTMRANREAWVAIDRTTGVVTPALGANTNAAICLNVALRRPQDAARDEILKAVTVGMKAIALLYHTEIAVKHAVKDTESLAKLIHGPWSDELRTALAKELLNAVVLTRIGNEILHYEIGSVEENLTDTIQILASIAGVKLIRSAL